jgi:hypothetical protein
MYDACAYSETLTQSVSPLAYMLDPIKYEHCNKCRIELGTVGGTAVSHINGNLVDLENNLLGIDRPGTLCSSYMYQPGQPLQGAEYIKPVQHPRIDTTMRHLPACQLTTYPSVPAPPAMPRFTCGGGQAPQATLPMR